MCDHHDHGHDCGGEDSSFEFSLYLKINLDGVQCLNEQEDGSARKVFKPWNDRLDQTKFTESDVDPELLFNIPFTGSVKLKSVALLGGENDSHPKSMKLFKNIPNMDLDQTCKQPDQVFELPQTYTDVLQIPTKTARFSSVHHLSIFFPDNYGAETTKVYYIGLKGDYKQAQRQEVLLTNYELAANPADHKHKLYDTSSHMIS